jgi:hypothetical protein
MRSDEVQLAIDMLRRNGDKFVLDYIERLETDVEIFIQQRDEFYDALWQYKLASSDDAGTLVEQNKKLLALLKNLYIIAINKIQDPTPDIKFVLDETQHELTLMIPRC